MVHVEGKADNMIANNLKPFCQTHPGEVIKDEIEARGISQKVLSEQIGMSYKAMNDILNERRPVTTETAMLFEAALGISAETLLGLQIAYNLANAKKNAIFLNRLNNIRKVAAVAL